MGQSHGSSSAAPTSQAEARSHAPSSNDTNNASSKQLPSLATNINRRKSDFRENRRTDSIERSKTVMEGKSSTNRIIDRRRSSSMALINTKGGTIMAKPKRMSPRQCHLVIKSWSKRLPKNRIAKEAFVAIFSEAQELKGLFGIDGSCSGKKLRSDPQFVKHITVFTNKMDFVIRNLDDFSLVIENAEQLGRRHVSFHQLSNNFHAEYWNVFSECIIEQASVGEDKETQLAWRTLIQTLAYYMKLGFEREMLRIHRSSMIRRSRQEKTQVTTSNANYKTCQDKSLALATTNNSMRVNERIVLADRR